MRLLTLFLLSVTILFGSCGQSSDVVNNGLLQKRKYRKGWHLSDLAKKSAIQPGKEKAKLDYRPSLELPEKEMPNSNIRKGYQNVKDSCHVQTSEEAAKDSKKGFLRHRPSRYKDKDPDNLEPIDESLNAKGRKLIISIILNVIFLFGMIVSMVLGAIILNSVLLPSFLVVLWLSTLILTIIYGIDYYQAKNGETYLNDEKLTKFGLTSKRYAILSTVILIGITILTVIAVVLFFLFVAANPGNVVGIILLALILLLILGIIVGIATLVYIVLASLGLSLGIASFKHNSDGKKGTIIIIIQLALQFLLFLAGIILVAANGVI